MLLSEEVFAMIHKPTGNVRIACGFAIEAPQPEANAVWGTTAWKGLGTIGLDHDLSQFLQFMLYYK